MKWNLIYFDDQLHNIDCYKLLLSKKFEVIGCVDSLEYQQILQTNPAHAILIDVHMPGFQGHELCSKITADPAYNGCPMIFISGDASDVNKLRSLNSGGVDFLTREMGGDEIEGRLASKIKLFQKTVSKLRASNLLMDLEALKVLVDGKKVDLTLIEMRILANALRSIPEGISREELLRKVWGDEKIKPGTINTHISWIKAKLSEWTHVLHVKHDIVQISEKKLVE